MLKYFTIFITTFSFFQCLSLILFFQAIKIIFKPSLLLYYCQLIFELHHLHSFLKKFNFFNYSQDFYLLLFSIFLRNLILKQKQKESLLLEYQEILYSLKIEFIFWFIYIIIINFIKLLKTKIENLTSLINNSLHFIKFNLI